MFLCLPECEFKRRRYFLNTSIHFEKRTIRKIQVSGYVWQIKKWQKETPTLVCEIIWTVVPHINIKPWSLCLREKLTKRLYLKAIVSSYTGAGRDIRTGTGEVVKSLKIFLAKVGKYSGASVLAKSVASKYFSHLGIDIWWYLT